MILAVSGFQVDLAAAVQVPGVTDADG